MCVDLQVSSPIRSFRGHEFAVPKMPKTLTDAEPDAEADADFDAEADADADAEVAPGGETEADYEMAGDGDMGEVT